MAYLTHPQISHSTAIATFPNGRYLDPAAIYISQNKDGIQVYDQVYTRGGKADFCTSLYFPVELF